jgi:hypothetical protein
MTSGTRSDKWEEQKEKAKKVQGLEGNGLTKGCWGKE